MQPLLVNTTDRDSGAARAAARLHSGLRRCGCDAHMLVARKDGSDETVIGPTSRIARAVATVRYYLTFLPAARTNLDPDEGLFSPAWLPDRVERRVAAIDPDVVHLHWIVGFVQPETLTDLDRPIVWTLHDMWPFTGGCHYDCGCGRYARRCGRCPVLDSDSTDDRSRRLWRRKRDSWRDLDPLVVAPSRWLADCARESSLLGDFRVERVPNGIDLDAFAPRDRDAARARLGLPRDRRLILSGATDTTRRKGLDLLATALDHLDAPMDVVCFGGADAAALTASDGRVHDLGFVPDHRLPLVYAAADATILPSRQDNLPNVAVESVACGTPVVAFDTGGVSDVVRHRRTGYLASSLDPATLATGVEWVVDDDERLAALSAAAREHAEGTFDLSAVADEYRRLYREVAE